MKKFTKATLAGVSALALAGSMAPMAFAEETDVTAGVQAGQLKLQNVSASLAFGNVAPGNTSGTQNLMADIDDQRAGTAGWSYAVSAAPLKDGMKEIPVGNMKMESAGATVNSGTVTPSASAGTAVSLSGTPQNSYTGTAISGNNNTTTTTGITLDMPASAVVGSYAGVITTSVS